MDDVDAAHIRRFHPLEQLQTQGNIMPFVCRLCAGAVG
jgi:hypothetical protein